MKNLYKTIFIIFYYCLNNIQVFSQAPQISWQKTIGGHLDEYLEAIQQTTDGGFIMAGTSASYFSSGDKTQNNCSAQYVNPDFWIVKIDNGGNIQWDRTIGGNANDELESIRQTSDGGYILGGTSMSNISCEKSENCFGTKDFWIVKLSSSGNIEWENTIGGLYTDILATVLQTNDGGYLLGGYSNSDISIDKTENRIGDDDYWIVKTDGLGNIQWQNTIGGDSIDRLSDVRATSDGGYILGGYSRSGISGDKTENNLGESDYWIVKVDSAGQIQWQNTIGGNTWDYLTSIRQTTDGGYIFAGSSNSTISGDKTEDCLTPQFPGMSYDYWIVKTDPTGNVVWDNTIGSTRNDIARDLQQTNDGGFIICGFSDSYISGDKTENNWPVPGSIYPGIDFWIVKTDGTGNIIWQNAIGGVDDDRPTCIDECSNGEIIVGGFSRSNISGDKLDDSKGSADYWILNLSNNYNLITGKLFLDLNSNNVQDAGEINLPNKKVNETSGIFSFTEQDGSYRHAVWNSGSFSVSADPINYYILSPASYNINFPSMLLVDSLNDFAYQPSGVIDDLCINITSNSLFRAGRNSSYTITYSNNGTTTLSPTIIFYVDTNLSFVSANPPANSITTDSIVWNLSPLGPQQSGNISLAVFVDSTVSLGSFIFATVRIEPLAGDVNPGCNINSTESRIVTSIDPNDISVDEDTLLTSQLSSPPYLDYTIRFQNTGNDTAFTVKILNPIDTSRLQLNTLEFVASSHPVNLNYVFSERNMEFKFDNILLPDSNIDELSSHGFVRYRIKPKNNLMTGDSIVNYAAIYFDFNAAVITNNAITHLVSTTSTFNITSTTIPINLFPNPAGDKITLVYPQSRQKAWVKFYDLMQREVIFQPLQNNNQSSLLDVSVLKPGIYLVEVFIDGTIAREKIIKL